MTAPITSSPDGCQHGSYHADDGDKTHEGEETSYDKVGDDNPIEVQARSGEMTMKGFLFLIFLFHKSLSNLSAGADVADATFFSSHRNSQK